MHSNQCAWTVRNFLSSCDAIQRVSYLGSRTSNRSQIWSKYIYVIVITKFPILVGLIYATDQQLQTTVTCQFYHTQCLDLTVYFS